VFVGCKEGERCWGNRGRWVQERGCLRRKRKSKRESWRKREK
jgi:hypothetical protein